MSIVALTKCSLIGPPARQEEALVGLQELGVCHIIPLAHDYAPGIAYSEEGMRALHYLEDCPDRLKARRSTPKLPVTELLERIEANRVAIQELTDRRDTLQTYAGNLRQWGYFRFPDLAAVGGLRLWFYRMPLAQLALIPESAPPWQLVGTDDWSAFVVAISAAEPPEDAMPIARMRTGRLDLESLERALDELEAELETAHDERADLTRFLPYLRQGLVTFNDDIARARVAGEVLTEPEYFVLQGWIPTRDRPRVVALAEAQGLAVCFEEPTAVDQPPTLLDNPTVLKGGEDLVTFFSTPGYRGWDPSILTFIAFGVFFSIILADAGYGGVFLIALLWGWSKMGRTAVSRRLRALGAWLTGATLVGGVLLGTYFGVEPSEGSWLHRLQLSTPHDTNAMINLSLILGVLHLSIANGVKAARRWPHPTALAPVGWILVMVGGLVAYLSGVFAGPGEWLLIGGALLILLFTGHYTPISLGNVMRQLWEGIHALIHSTKVFGDTLSYMRLFALCLAGASLAQVFNDQGMQIIHDSGAFGIVFGPLVILIGHVLNMLLSIMGGAVHGLRLNFIEFLSWADIEDGTSFAPLRKTATQE